MCSKMDPEGEYSVELFGADLTDQVILQKLPAVLQKPGDICIFNSSKKWYLQTISVRFTDYLHLFADNFDLWPKLSAYI